MVSQVHNFLPLVGWWFLKKTVWVGIKPKHEKKCSSQADVVGQANTKCYVMNNELKLFQ